VRRKIILSAVFCWFALALPLGSRAVDSHKPKVLTTVSPLTDIVHNIGGSLIELHGLIPEGTDSHTFEPAPSDVRFMAEADLIILNGLHLETPVERLAAANKKPAARILKLGDNTITQKDWVFDFSFPHEKGDPNPHLWLNVAYAMRYAELVRDALMQLDPANKQIYEQKAKRYLARLSRLDEAIRAAMRTIPAKNRKLVTYHDSFAYFCPRYGCTVIGAIQPSDFSEPAPRDVAALIDQLKAERVPAIFGSEVFPSKVLNQIGKEAGVKFISTLRDDDLPGPPGSSEHTYIGMMIQDVRTIVRSLGGNDNALKGIDAADRVR
jgi:manganese/iron transport system substrate-binding protein